MTQDEIIEMARQAGIRDSLEYDHMECDPKSLEAFAKLVAAKEREACAGLCDRFANRMMSAEECADAIRARGEA